MFVHLHCHSHYSFLRGASAPGDYVRAAAACGMPAVALTDTNGLYAAIAFYQEAVAAGVKPILGVELDYSLVRSAECGVRNGPRSKVHPVPTPGGSIPRAIGGAGWNGVQGPKSEKRSAISDLHSATTGITQASSLKPQAFSYSAFRSPHSALGPCPLPQAPARACGAHDQSESLVLLALSRAGYANLCRLVSIRQVRERPVTVEELARHGADVAALSHALAPLPALEEIYGDRLYIEARAPDGSRALRAALEASRALGIPVAATNAVHFCAPEDHLTHRVLTAIREGSLLSKLPPEITAPPDAWFRPPEAMAAAFAAAPEAVRATLEIAERANVRFDFGQLIFPHFELPEGESAFSLLWKLCFEGAAQRYRPLTPRVIARLQQELEAIEKLNLAPYFLIVWDIVRHAASQGIPTVGRGSAASSIVAYCLGITSICPLRYGLYFERFLNEQRRDVPDIDLDICGRRRDEVLAYVYKKYGEERVAMISSFVTMQARLAVREVGKVFGMNPQELNHFCRRLPHRPVHELCQMLRALPECRGLPVEEEPYRTVLDVALRLDQAPRHLGIHPCGTVISHAPLTELAPLELATKGIVVTQYDMHSIEALGLIKMDLLGQRALTTFTDTLNALRARGVEVDFWHLPEDEPAARRLIRSGQTMGVFQVESPGMRGLLRAIRADTIEQVCLALAPAGGVGVWLEGNVPAAASRRGAGALPALGARADPERIAGRVHLPGAGAAHRRGPGRLQLGGSRPAAPPDDPPALGRGDAALPRRVHPRLRRARHRVRNGGADLAVAREIRRLRLLQGARRHLRRHGLAHLLPEGALPGRVHGRGVQLRRGLLPSGGLRGGSAADEAARAAAVLEPLRGGLHRRAGRVAHRADAGEEPDGARHGVAAGGAPRGRAVRESGGFSAARGRRAQRGGVAHQVRRLRLLA